MRRSADHILSTHGGNLPRPADLDALLVKADDHRAAIEARLPGAVKEVVDKQIACGVDIVNDGEYVKAANMGNYVGYIQARVTGFEYQVRGREAAPGKAIIPGVVGHATDLVEHPELVAERLLNYAKLVGMENLQAGTDCGIGSRVGHEEVVWAKLKAMADGAAIATKRLKGR